LVSLVVYISFVVATLVTFWSSLIEATYLTVRPVSLNAARWGTRGAGQASNPSEKTRLVSTTTLLDTITNVVVLASAFVNFMSVHVRQRSKTFMA